MKQDAQLTAVEWFNQQLVDRQNGNGDSRSRDEIFEQAKEMEREQTIEFANEYSRAVIGGCLLTRTEFYNETFKSE